MVITHHDDVAVNAVLTLLIMVQSKMMITDITDITYITHIMTSGSKGVPANLLAGNKAF